MMIDDKAVQTKWQERYFYKVNFVNDWAFRLKRGVGEEIQRLKRLLKKQE